ncbi:MAG: hypothetical protein AMJ79_12790 [Phycisphaerae bacterium SM23_30]|nr:MAG: hypothetical protein AMJ79_12790 [Phycisphaerae bacterium SM23_30]
MNPEKIKRLESIESRLKALDGDIWWSAEYNDLEIDCAGIAATFTMSDESISAIEDLLNIWESRL